MAKSINKDKSMKEAQRIKELLLKSTKPDLGLADGDVTLKQDADGYVEVTILKGRAVPHEDGVGASAKNVSSVIDKDFTEFRKKGWTFTQPQGGSFSIGVPEEKMNEGFTFAKFLESDML